MKEEKNIKIVKVSKGEMIDQKEKKKHQKIEKKERMPERDRIQYEKAKKTVIMTVLLFAVAILFLALIVLKVIDNKLGIACLILIAALSTYISRRKN